ncbi:MAG: sulfatase-like hydrolase/transferase [Acidobacteriota bacterium]
MRRKKAALAVAAPLLAILAGLLLAPLRERPDHPAGTRTPEIDRPNVLLITLDTTRADHLGAYGYRSVRTPSLDALAKHGVLFEQCVASSPLTLPSHSSIMTGLYPTCHGVRVNGNTALSAAHETLAEAFAAQGYDCGAFVGAFVLDGRWGLNQGFHHYDDQFDLKKYKKLDLGLVQRPGDQVVSAALSWLDNHGDRPFFAWIHLYDPHTPYAPPEPYLSEYKRGGIVGLYDGEIAFMDEQIGRCMAWLDEHRVRERTVVAIIGDHGEGLGDHGELTHGYFIYDYAVHVPFLLVAPWVERTRVAAQVRTIDLYPTLLSAAKILIPEEVQGESVWPLLDSRSAAAARHAYSESMTPKVQYGWAPLLAIRTPAHKYIDAPRPEFYDLRDDPHELADLGATSSPLVAEYGALLEKLIADSSSGAPAPVAADLDSETVARLAALGYIGAPIPERPRTGAHAPLIDPKDGLAVHEAIQRAGELSNLDRYAEASCTLEQVLREDPANPQAMLLLANCYVELERSNEAKRLLSSVLQQDPRNVQALVCMAKILQGEGQGEDVIRVCKRALEVDERNTLAHTLMGQAYMDRQDYANALPSLQRAVEIQPKLTQNHLNLAACMIGLKRYADAQRTLDEILAAHPKFPLAHFHLGLLYEGMGDLPAATQAYRAEIDLNGDCYMARFNLGRILLRRGDLDHYMEQMREVTRIAPENPLGYLFLARGLLQQDADPGEILDLANKGLVLARTPEHKALAYFLLADVYSRRDQPQLVQQALEKAKQHQRRTEK